MSDITSHGTLKEIAALVASIQGQPELQDALAPTLRIESTEFATQLWLNGARVNLVSKITFSHIGGKEPQLEITYSDNKREGTT